MLFEEAHEFGVDLETMFAQELGGLVLAPTNVTVKAPPANILVNRVPEGFTPILIDLQRCSRSELRRFLHKMLCSPQPSADDGTGNSVPRERPLGRCGCELIEFDYQPDFMFNKRNDDGDSEDNVGDSDDVESTDDEFGDNSDDEGIGSSEGLGTLEHETDDGSRGLQSQHEQDTERTKIKIKRPPNSFMIYRSERHKELVKIYKGGNKVISGIIAKEWHNMKPEDKKKYEDMAAIKKHEHEMLYPNYKFMPKRRKLE
ncbi:hypothetical protein IWW50_002007 [Coemansia erecta]|nr:hypothetical protein GGF43_002376 [Coemansia sp. RSA 2618]KAJ2827196.1 hypothetical protein IWW50_002007 [Coemansia erecta]